MVLEETTKSQAKLNSCTYYHTMEHSRSLHNKIFVNNMCSICVCVNICEQHLNKIAINTQCQQIAHIANMVT